MFLKLISKIYSYFVDRRNSQYNNGEIELVKCDIPVISIGNLSVGGSGKTPVTIFIANLLKENGIKPGIIGRGYKRRSSGEIIVSGGEDENGELNIEVSAEEAGDEMYLVAKETRCPVIASEIKNQAALSIQSKFDIDCILVDDGYQHRKLHRDINILLIDDQTLKYPELIPKGRLREKFANYKRADIVLITANVEKNNSLLKPILDSCVFFYVERYEAGSFILNNNSKFDNLSINDVVLLSSIANPVNYENNMKSLGKKIIKHFIFNDHHNYTERDIINIINYLKKNSINYLFTTEKDSVKLIKFLNEFISHKINIIVNSIGINIYRGKGDTSDNAESVNHFKNLLLNKMIKKNENE